MTRLADMTRKNTFDHARIIEGEKRRAVLKAHCSKKYEGCMEEGTIKLSSGAITCDQEFADKAFRNKGWHVGKYRTDDVCPHCVAWEKAERERKRREEEEAAQAAAEPQAAEVVMTEPTPAKIKPALPTPLTREQLPPWYYEPLTLSKEQQELIAEYIQPHMVQRPNGLWAYKPGEMNDKKATAELLSLIPHLNVNSTKAVRLKYWGQSSVHQASRGGKWSAYKDEPQAPIASAPAPEPAPEAPKPDLFETIQQAAAAVESETMADDNKLPPLGFSPRAKGDRLGREVVRNEVSRLGAPYEAPVTPILSNKELAPHVLPNSPLAQALIRIEKIEGVVAQFAAHIAAQSGDDLDRKLSERITAFQTELHRAVETFVHAELDEMDKRIDAVAEPPESISLLRNSVVNIEKRLAAIETRMDQFDTLRKLLATLTGQAA